jgi:hypothetical protein
MPILHVMLQRQLSQLKRRKLDHRPVSASYILLTGSKVKVTLRLTVGQSVNLGVEPHLGLMTRYLLHFDFYGLVFLGRPL